MSIITPGSVLKDRTTLKTYRLPSDKEALDICRWAAEKISWFYPKLVWHVEINQDLLFVKCMSLNMDYGYRCRLKDIDDFGVKLKKIGGEILERFNVSRERTDAELVANIPRNVVGDAKPDAPEFTRRELLKLDRLFKNVK